MNEIIFCYASVKNDTKPGTSSSTRLGMYIVGVCNAVLAVPTIVGNVLVIVAILKTYSLRTPSYLLLTSLAFSDLAVGTCSQPVLSAMIFGILFKQRIVKYIIPAYIVVGVLTNSVSVFTLTAISVDRYLAIRIKMRYRSVVTSRRTRYFIVMAWTFSIAFMSYVVTHRFNKILVILTVFFITMCLLVIVFCYTMSFKALKIHCAQTQPQGNQQPNSTTQTNAIDVLKYRKLLNTMVLILMLVFICYLPLIAIFFVMIDPSCDRLSDYAPLITIMTLNSTLNPVIYITRMVDIRQACTRILKKILFKEVP